MSQKFLSVPSAFEQVTGTRPHPSTCWRYATKGSGGVRLRTWMVGGKRQTTIAAVTDFIVKRTVDETAGTDVSEVKRDLQELAQ